MTIPHYWNPQQVERLPDSLAALGLRRARVAALIMWRSGLRVGETVALAARLRNTNSQGIHPGMNGGYYPCRLSALVSRWLG